MPRSNSTNPSEAVIKWIPRIWSAIIAVIALAIIIAPDPYLVKPVPITDWIELGFIDLAIVGLLIAWRWERLGGIIAIGGVIGHYVAFYLARGSWSPNYLYVVIFAVPVVLYLTHWKISHRQKPQAE